MKIERYDEFCHKLFKYLESNYSDLRQKIKDDEYYDENHFYNVVIGHLYLNLKRLGVIESPEKGEPIKFVSDEMIALMRWYDLEGEEKLQVAGYGGKWVAVNVGEEVLASDNLREDLEALVKEKFQDI